MSFGHVKSPAIRQHQPNHGATDSLNELGQYPNYFVAVVHRHLDFIHVFYDSAAVQLVSETALIGFKRCVACGQSDSVQVVSQLGRLPAAGDLQHVFVAAPGSLGESTRTTKALHEVWEIMSDLQANEPTN